MSKNYEVSLRHRFDLKLAGIKALVFYESPGLYTDELQRPMPFLQEVAGSTRGRDCSAKWVLLNSSEIFIQHKVDLINVFKYNAPQQTLESLS